MLVIEDEGIERKEEVVIFSMGELQTRDSGDVGIRLELIVVDVLSSDRLQ